MDKPVSAVELMYLCHDYVEADRDIEAYCPPDDSDSWPVFATEMIQERSELQDKLEQLLRQADAYGIDIDL